jgi:hypothetical protein
MCKPQPPTRQLLLEQQPSKVFDALRCANLRTSRRVRICRENVAQRCHLDEFRSGNPPERVVAFSDKRRKKLMRLADPYSER